MLRHVRTISAAVVLLFSFDATAANYVGLYGDYYLERSTRVLSPMVQISTDLPSDSQAKLTYLIDQITSASAAVTPGQDAVFQEYRQEFRIDANKKFDGLTPNINFRYSTEPDYRSVGGGLGTSIDLVEDFTTLDVNVQLLYDNVVEDSVRGMSDARELDRNLITFRFAVGLTQVIRKNVLAGVVIDTQVLRGYMENQYRNDVYPNKGLWKTEIQARDRLAIAGWGAYYHQPTNTTFRLDARLYTDTWKLNAFSSELRVTQRILPSLDIEPRIRFHIQDAVFFHPPSPTSPFRTEDPKLTAFNAQTFGLQLSWKLTVLEDTSLAPFADMLIQPYYAYMRQTNRYGNAHIAQLGAFWPF